MTAAKRGTLPRRTFRVEQWWVRPYAPIRPATVTSGGNAHLLTGP